MLQIINTAQRAMAALSRKFPTLLKQVGNCGLKIITPVGCRLNSYLPINDDLFGLTNEEKQVRLGVRSHRPCHCMTDLPYRSAVIFRSLTHMRPEQNKCLGEKLFLVT